MRSVVPRLGSLVLATVAAAAALSAAGCGATTASTAAASSSSANSATAAGSASSGSGSSSVSCSYDSNGSPARKVDPPPAAEPKGGTVTASLTLNSGVVTMALDPARTPCTVGSFVHLAQAGYFDGTTCHRLTTTAGLQVLQCGDPSGTGSGGPGYSFADETTPDMTYPTGTVAMANSGPNTNGSQFFLVYGDSTLPPSYTVFGSITGGLPVLQAIAKVGVSGGGDDGAPAQPVTITKASITAG